MKMNDFIEIRKRIAPHGLCERELTQIHSICLKMVKPLNPKHYETLFRQLCNGGNMKFLADILLDDKIMVGGYHYNPTQHIIEGKLDITDLMINYIPDDNGYYHIRCDPFWKTDVGMSLGSIDQEFKIHYSMVECS